jgi:hypothetical protein
VVPKSDGIDVNGRALQWEWASKLGTRRVHRVERAEPGAGTDWDEDDAYILDLETTCKGANRHDFTKFVRSYIPECSAHFITE